MQTGQPKKKQQLQLAEVTIDQLDGTYQGQLNQSHQKHGTGIFLSTNYDTYVGQWKNNNLHGRGCIIFRSGRLFLAEFNRSKPFGIVIVRTSQGILCGTLEPDRYKLTGMAFQFEYRSAKWQMLHCQRNIHAMPTAECTTVLAEEDRQLSRGPPRIMSSEPEMFAFMDQFLSNFQSLLTFGGRKYLTKSNGKSIIGGCNKQSEPHGLAVVMRDLQLEQVGTFSHGRPHGYVCSVKGSAYLIGFYDQGQRNGVFEQYEQSSSKTMTGSQYAYGQFVATLQPASISAALQIERRRYLDRSKNFISLRNIFSFSDLQAPLTKPPDPRIEQPRPSKVYTKKRVIIDQPEHSFDRAKQNPSSTSEKQASYRVRTVSQFEQSCLATVRKRMPYLQRLLYPDRGNNYEDDGIITHQESPFS